MIDFARIIGFDWDQGNSRKSTESHQVSQSEAEQIFFNQPLFVLIDERHSGTELHWHALGVTDAGRRLHLTFTLREDDTKIRIISARDMSRKEREFYAQQS